MSSTVSMMNDSEEEIIYASDMDHQPLKQMKFIDTQEFTQLPSSVSLIYCQSLSFYPILLLSRRTSICCMIEV